MEAVAALREDAEQLHDLLAAAGYGAVALGSDLARTPQRVNPHSRYRAMEDHFDALGCAGCGSEMMTATAALQVNLDAGPAPGWEERLSRIRTLVPMLVALSATSPWLGGRTSGWHSMRQGVWQGIDHGRSDPVGRGEPTGAWATYALDAPVMLVRSPGGGSPELVPVTERIPFAQWLRGAAPFGRPATTADLDYHLTTLFPPIRPAGLPRAALPRRGARPVVACGPWPSIATVLIDDPARRPRRGRGLRRADLATAWLSRPHVDGPGRPGPCTPSGHRMPRHRGAAQSRAALHRPRSTCYAELAGPPDSTPGDETPPTAPPPPIR